MVSTKIPIGQQIILTECFPELDKLEPCNTKLSVPKTYQKEVYISYTFPSARKLIKDNILLFECCSGMLMHQMCNSSRTISKIARSN